MLWWFLTYSLLNLYDFLLNYIYKLVTGDISVCYFVFYDLSRDILSVNFLKVLLYLLMGISLLTGQCSDLSTAAFSLSLSCSTSSQSYTNIWSVVCSPFLQGHIGLSVILYFYKYDLILPCAVTIVVKFGVTLIFNFNLSAILGNYNFVIAPFTVLSHSLCHNFTPFSLNSLFTVLFGILL